MFSLNQYCHTGGFGFCFNGVGNLYGHFFLDLRTAGNPIRDAIELTKSNDVLSRKDSDIGTPHNILEVMSTRRADCDRSCDVELVVFCDIGKSGNFRCRVKTTTESFFDKHLGYAMSRVLSIVIVIGINDQTLEYSLHLLGHFFGQLIQLARVFNKLTNIIIAKESLAAGLNTLADFVGHCHLFTPCKVCT